MEDARIVLSFIVPIILIFFMVKKNVDTTFFLIISAVVSGVIAGLPLTSILSTIKTGFGSVLSQVGLLVLFGMIFSEYLEASGGMACLAGFISKKTSPQGSLYAIYALGYVISIPVNFTAATTMMCPLIRRLSNDTGKPIQSYACAFSVSSFLTNCLVVPTLTPALLAGMAKIELGPFMLVGIVLSLVTSLVAALCGALLLAKRYGNIQRADSLPPEDDKPEDTRSHPPVKLVTGLILFPIILILLGTFVPALLPEGTLIREVIAFIGDPVGALLCAILVEIVLLRNYLGKDTMPVFTRGLQHAGGLLIVLGAANSFGSVLSGGGIGDVILGLLSVVDIPILLVAFLMVAILRAGTGAMTVAATAALSLLLPVLDVTGGSPTLLVAACCLGCVALIIPSCTEFWIFKDAYHLSVKDTLISITIPGSISAIVGIILLLAFSALFPGISF